MTHYVLRMIHGKTLKPRHILVKLQNSKDKKETEKSREEKKNSCCCKNVLGHYNSMFISHVLNVAIWVAFLHTIIQGTRILPSCGSDMCRPAG